MNTKYGNIAKGNKSVYKMTPILVWYIEMFDIGIKITNFDCDTKEKFR